MSSAQTWTLIGGFFAIVAAMVGLVIVVIDAKVDGLRNEMVARFESLERELQRLYEVVFAREGPPAA